MANHIELGYRSSKQAVRRTMFLFGAGLGSVVSCMAAWLDWRGGLYTSVPQDLFLAAVLVPLFIWGWKTTNPVRPARIGMLVFALTFVPSLPNELIHMPLFMLWLPVIPMLAFYFFGFREGLIWAGCFFLLILGESWWVLSATMETQYMLMLVQALIAYLFLVAVGASFQYLIEGYERQLVKDSEARQQVHERMAEIQKLETVGVLAGGIAHDFNNLLVGVLGNAELALLDTDKHSAVHPCLEQIIKSAHHGSDLVRQMLAYSGQGKIETGPQNLNVLLGDVSDLLATVLGKGIRVEHEQAEELPLIRGDKNQLSQLMMNLLTNASDAMQGEPGEIHLRTGVTRLSRMDLDAMGAATDAMPGDYVFVQVEDNGCGMDIHTRARMFDPFFTTKASGTGLGLAALRGIVHGHRGALSVSSKLGEGSCFTVFFPVPAATVAEKAVAVDASGTAVQAPELTVLLVDDDKQIRMVTRQMLEREGVRVITAVDGEQAVALFRQHAAAITVVLMDLTMPGMDGQQAFQAIRHISPDARVVLSCGFPESCDMESLRAQGLAGLIRKPYTRELLLDEIARVSTST